VASHAKGIDMKALAKTLFLCAASLYLALGAAHADALSALGLPRHDAAGWPIQCWRDIDRGAEDI
jgi:hypothetical protein